jgi:hypothetical protein
MPVKLNRTAFNHAQQLINRHKVVIDERGAWSEHPPSSQQENEFIRLHGFYEYSKWYLGIDDAQDEGIKVQV